MRALTVRVPRGRGEAVLAMARRHGGTHLARLEATTEAGAEPCDLVLAHLPNEQVGPLLDALEDVPDLHVTLQPHGVITLRPPAAEASEQVTDVGARSPIEVFLAGLQSVGSWTGFLAYAAAAGVVVWIGLYTGTVYLLTASMLIAPFAGPAMNAALATARGDAALLGRSLARYLAGLAVAVLVAGALSLALGQEATTAMMVSVGSVSAFAVLLPIVAGAAGALNLCQSDRNSLVSGAATGMLVAASLTPPAGILGMGAVLGEWGLVQAAAFLLLLQLVGINLSGAVVFRLYGLSPRGVRYARGRRGVGIAAWASSAAALAGLLAWQFAAAPELRRSTQAQRAAAELRQAVQESGLARLVDSEVRFTRADVPGPAPLLVIAYVEAEGGVAPDEVRRALPGRIRTRLSGAFDAAPMIAVTVLETGRDAGG